MFMAFLIPGSLPQGIGHGKSFRKEEGLLEKRPVEEVG
jgi:hypothetical protein